MRARIAAYTLHSQVDGTAHTQKARDAFLARFEAQVDPELKLASAEFARPDVASDAVQLMDTLAACQDPSAAPHAIWGGVLSYTTVLSVLVDALFLLPAASWATLLAMEASTVPSPVMPLTAT